MKTLKELILIVTPNKLKKITLLSDLSEQTKLKQLYEGIHQDKWKDEDAAMKAIYGNNEKSRSSFSKLKHDLTHKLFDTFHLINITEGEQWEHRKALWDCYTIHHTAFLLLKLTPARNTAIELFEKIFSKCLKYQFSDLVANIASKLTTHYHQMDVNPKKAAYYSNLALEYAKIHVHEIKGGIYLSEIYGYSVKNKGCKPFLPALVQERLDDFRQTEIAVPTLKIIYFEKTLALMVARAAYHYHEVIAHCEDALTFFENAPYTDRSTLRGFYLKAIEAQIYMKQLEGANAKLEKCNEIIEEGSYNWFKIKELYLKILLYQKKEQAAYDHYLTITAHPRFANLPKHLKEIWTIHEGFFYIMQQLNRIQQCAKKEFRLQSFLNNMPNLQRDKGGMNFTLHLVQILIVLIKNEADCLEKVMLRIENLRRYAYRYQHDYGTDRSRKMIDILDEVSIYGFESKVLHSNNHRVQEALFYLKEIPYDILDNNYDYEPLALPDVFVILSDVLTHRDSVPD
jgi:hypothetical protein